MRAGQFTSVRFEKCLKVNLKKRVELVILYHISAIEVNRESG